ncbi:MAG: hypothetical protein QXI58_02390 [Candidatus Micrarchaeia archaeon]
MKKLRVCISTEPKLWREIKKLARKEYLSTSSYVRLLLKKQLEGENSE